MIVVDVEATGTNPEKHSILSIGAIDFDNPTNQFYGECRAWEGAHIEDEALAVNGFSKAEVFDPEADSEEELVASFVAWATDCHGWNFLGQNPSFDLNFVAAACHRAHIDFPFPHRTIDTHTLAYMHIVKNGNTPPFNEEHHRSNMNLDYILSYTGVPQEPKPHNALTGAMCHAEVAARLLYDRQLLPEFEVYPIPWTVIKRG